MNYLTPSTSKRPIEPFLSLVQIHSNSLSPFDPFDSTKSRRARSPQNSIESCLTVTSTSSSEDSILFEQDDTTQGGDSDISILSTSTSEGGYKPLFDDGNLENGNGLFGWGVNEMDFVRKVEANALHCTCATPTRSKTPLRRLSIPTSTSLDPLLSPTEDDYSIPSTSEFNSLLAFIPRALPSQPRPLITSPKRPFSRQSFPPSVRLVTKNTSNLNSINSMKMEVEVFKTIVQMETYTISPPSSSPSSHLTFPSPDYTPSPDYVPFPDDAHAHFLDEPSTRLVSNSLHLIQFVTELEMIKRKKITSPLRVRNFRVVRGRPLQWGDGNGLGGKGRKGDRNEGSKLRWEL